MTKRQGSPSGPLTVREDQGLFGVVVIENGQQATTFYVEGVETDEAPADHASLAAVQAIGAWADLDWDAAVDELDQIRHQSAPTPPFDL